MISKQEIAQTWLVAIGLMASLYLIPSHYNGLLSFHFAVCLEIELYRTIGSYYDRTVEYFKCRKQCTLGTTYTHSFAIIDCPTHVWDKQAKLPICVWAAYSHMYQGATVPVANR